MQCVPSKPHGRAVALALFAALGLWGCRRPQPPAAAPPPAAAEKPPAAPLVTGPQTLDRGGIIAAARLTGEALVLGRPYPADAAGLVGSRFEARLPFGCAGATPDTNVGYSVDARRGTLTLRARPETWTRTPWVAALLGAQDIEAVEGFWLRRPWLSADACPALHAGAVATPAPETLGLARVFRPGESRVLRHGAHGYEVVKKAEPGTLRLGGFRLVLAGRIADFGDHQPIRCRYDGPEARPVCLVAVEFDRVTFEDPVSGEVLAEWRS